MSKQRGEEEHFERIEREKLARLRSKLDRENLTEQQRVERETHFHKCGKCGAQLVAKMFRGVEIEVCPRCGAVLLDPGELEKLAGADGNMLVAGIKALFSGSGD